jgi:hypothetical protein
LRKEEIEEANEGEEDERMEPGMKKTREEGS